MTKREAKLCVISDLSVSEDIYEAREVILKNEAVLSREVYTTLIKLIDRGIYINRLYGGFDSDYRIPHFIELVIKDIEKDARREKLFIA